MDNTTIPMPIYYCPKNYPTLVLTLYVYLLPGIMVFGLVGNALAFAVFWHQRKDKCNGHTHLLSCLAVVDSFYILTSTFKRLLPTIAAYHDQPILYWAIYTTPIASFFASTGKMLTSYMQVLLTAQRYVLICHPFKVTRWMSLKKTAFVFLATGVFCVAYNIPRFLQSEVCMRFNTCLSQPRPTLVLTELGKNYIFSVLYRHVFRLIFPSTIPLIAMMVLTRKIYKHLKNRPLATQNQTTVIARAVIIINVVFILCKAPGWVNSIVFCIRSILKVKSREADNFRLYFNLICNTLFTISSSINCVVYFICGTQFRQTFKGLLPFCSCTIYTPKSKVYTIEA